MERKMVEKRPFQAQWTHLRNQAACLGPRRSQTNMQQEAKLPLTQLG